MKNDLWAPIGAGVLMLVCCGLPLVFVGGGAVDILAWLGGLDLLAVIAAVILGGVIVTK